MKPIILYGEKIVYCTSYVSFQWSACQQTGMSVVFFTIALSQRHSLCNKKNTELSFLFPKIPTNMQSEVTWRSICKSFQAESSFFIKIFIELIDSKSYASQAHLSLFTLNYIVAWNFGAIGCAKSCVLPQLLSETPHKTRST